MAKTSLGIGTKITALLISSALLTGCYKIEMKEALNLDGTSEIALKVDMSGMATTMNGLAMNMENSVQSSIMDEVTAPEETVESYKSCSDPKLIEKYGAKTLEGPERIESVLAVNKVTTCQPSKTEGLVSITTDHIDAATEDVLFSQTIERKGDSCNTPALLAFYRVADFSKPITEPYTLKRTLEISCSDLRDDISVTTITTFEGQATPEPVIENFAKTKPEVIPENTLAELDALTLSTEEIEAKEKAENLNVCDDTEQNPETLPFFFTKCESSTPGVGIFHYTKYDTTGFKINPNGTVTYNLEPSTKTFNDNVNKGLEENKDGSMPADMDPAMFGFAVDYVLVSPWPIIDHSVGELEDEHTLRVDLLKMKEAQTFSVTFDTDGSSLELISPKRQLQIDNLIKGLEDQLAKSNAPEEKQVEYIYHLSGKIQRLAAIKPNYQVPLGYLQTKLINLAKKIEAGPMADLEAELTAELKKLDTDTFADDEEVFAETEAPIEVDSITTVNPTDEAEKASVPDESPDITKKAEDTLPTEEESETSETETSELEAALKAADETAQEDNSTVEDNNATDADEEEENFDDDEESPTIEGEDNTIILE